MDAMEKQLHAANKATQLNMLKMQLRNAQQSIHDASTMQAKQTSLSGQYMINGAGEAIVEVYFPVRFVEKPLVTFGFEMKDGEVYIPGQMATGSGVVLDWITEEKPPVSRIYIGCVIGAVTTGQKYQKMIGVWQANGVAYTDPVE